MPQVQADTAATPEIPAAATDNGMAQNQLATVFNPRLGPVRGGQIAKALAPVIPSLDLLLVRALGGGQAFIDAFVHDVASKLKTVAALACCSCGLCGSTCFT